MKFLFLALILLVNFSVYGRKFDILRPSDRDSSYVESFSNDLIISIYTSEKTHSLDLRDATNSYRLQYLPNGKVNMGVGFSYRGFGISLATRVPFFQENEDRKGETKRLGIQSYFYSNKFSFDLLTSFSKGYYLNRSLQHFGTLYSEREYQRPDIASANIGVSANYIFNHRKFSYKAAFTNTERQRKSAGSLLAGAGILSYFTRADSAFVPRGIDEKYFPKSRDVKETGILAFNLNGGYAYSLVFLKNGIVTVSYLVGSGIQENKVDKTILPGVSKLILSLNQTGRFGIGYRLNKYYLRASFISSSQFTRLKHNDLIIRNGTDYFQVSLAKRFSLN
ncbi:MAG TPA: hypothetical protein DHV48_04625 [Prolixibacteraceae bacterium]|nr:MAG: hypothetical protein A2066_16685 [Bacteroidetes bacterium GWB2_41_8]HCY40627.1 hypothetical protein [Prolixibacteraceae bacterium]